MVSATAGMATYEWYRGVTLVGTDQDLWITEAGYYYVVGFDGEGCPGASEGLVVTGIGTPTVAITPSGPLEFCSGNTVTLYATLGFANYLWSNGQTGPSIVVNSTGDYSVTASTTGGCSTVSNTLVVQVFPGPPAPEITINGDLSFCAGGSVQLTSSYTTGIQWNNDETTQTINVTQTGDYQVTYTDNEGCQTQSEIISVTVSSPNAQLEISGEVEICTGQTLYIDPILYGAYYQWYKDGDVIQASFDPSIGLNQNGHYWLVATDFQGCTAISDSIHLIVNPAAAALISVIEGTTTFCTGGSVTLEASSGATWLWSNGAATQQIEVTSSANLSVVVTNEFGCSAQSETTQVLVSSPNVELITSGDVEICEGQTFYVDPPFAGAALYQWYKDGDVIQSGPDPVIGLTQNGFYWLFATDAQGCTAESDSIHLIVNPAAIATISLIEGSTDFCSGGSVTLEASAGVSWLWSNDATTQQVEITTGGSISVVVTDISGCIAVSEPININVTSPLNGFSVNAVNFFLPDAEAFFTASTNGVIETYNWDFGDLATSSFPTPTHVYDSAGVYNVSLEVTDDAGCSANLTQNQLLQVWEVFPTVDYSLPIQANILNAVWLSPLIGYLPLPDGTICYTTTGGEAIGGNPGWTVINTIPDNPFYGISYAGNANYYKVWIAGGTGAVCYSTNGGDFEQINPGGLEPGTVFQGVTFPEPDFGIAFGNNNTVCLYDPTHPQQVGGWVGINPEVGGAVTSNTIWYGGYYNNGIYYIFGSGGAVCYYSGGIWYDGVASGGFGNWNFYNVRYSSGTNCAFAVGQGGTVYATFNGGANWVLCPPSFNYDWYDVAISGTTVICVGASGAIAVSNDSGNTWELYSIGSLAKCTTVRIEECVAYITTEEGGVHRFDVPFLISLSPNISASQPAICDGQEVVLSVDNPGIGYDYLWSNGAVGTSTTVFEPGSYSVNEVRYCGSNFSIDLEIGESNPPATPEIIVNGNLSLCAGQSVELSSSYATGNLWSTGDTNQTIVVAEQGVYSLTHTNAEGCQSEPASVEVQINSPNSALPVSGTVNLCGDEQLIIDPPFGGDFYNWYQNGDVIQSGYDPSITITDAGTYWLDATDINGCTSQSDTIVVTNFSASIATIEVLEGNTTICTGQSVLLGASAGASWLWSNGATGQTAEITLPGLYFVTVTDSSGCVSISESIEIFGNSPLSGISVNEVNFFLPDASAQFTSTTSGNISSYDWDFGDLSTSSFATPIHVYDSAGVYDVSLLVEDEQGCAGSILVEDMLQVWEVFPTDDYSLPTPAEILNCTWLSPLIGYLPLPNGTICRTTTGGAPVGLNPGWTSISTGTNFPFYGITYSGNGYGSRIWIAGANGYVCYSDDGNTFQDVNPPGTSGVTFRGVTFPSSNYGFAYGSNNTVCVYNNGNWDAINPPEGEGVTSGTIWYGGYYNNGNLFIVGSGGVICIYDGANWSPAQTNYPGGFGGWNFYNVRYSAATNCAFAVGQGGIVYASFDGGFNWVLCPTQVSYDWFDVAIIGSTVICVGADGAIYVSLDGGYTWQLYSIGRIVKCTAIRVVECVAYITTEDGGVHRFEIPGIDLAPAEIEASQLTICPGQEVVLSLVEPRIGSMFSWSNGVQDSLTITITEPGDYFVTETRFCGTTTSQIITVSDDACNYDCSDATVITPVMLNVPYGMGLPTIGTAIGNLFGALPSGTPQCSGTGAADVFYTFNVPFENHYWVRVNPFGGADLVLELLDVCGGTIIECANDFGPGQEESMFVQNLAAGWYVIRVHGALDEVFTASTGQHLVTVQGFPTSKVMDGTGCNETDKQLEDVIRCNLVTDALDYEWRFVEVGGGLDASFKRSSISNAGSSNNRNLRLSWVPGIDYNKLYNVYVRGQLNVPGVGDVWGVYRIFGDLEVLGSSDCFVETGTSVTPTQLRPEYSPNNPASGLPHTFCNGLVATWVGLAEQFQWELDGPTFHEVTSPSYFVNLGSIAGLQAGQVYQVRVRARVNGLWGSYGVQLPVSIGLPSNTQVLGYLCGTTRALNQAIAAVNTCGASSYTFRFQHATEAERIIVRPAYTCPLWLVTPALTPGETYSVTVKVAQGGVDGDYSTACDITIAGPQAEGLADDMMVSKVATESGMGIYPNPNTGSEVRVELNGIEDGAHNVEVTIYDIYGKLMTRDVFGHQGSQLSRLVRFENELATGIYLVHVTINGEIFAIEKLIVK
jgi:PKD repeat protein